MRFVLVGCVMLCASLVTACAATPAADDAQPTGEACSLDATLRLRFCDCPPGCGPCAQVCIAPGVWTPCEPGPGACDGGPQDLGHADAAPLIDAGRPSTDAAPPIDYGFACGHHCEPCCPGGLCGTGGDLLCVGGTTCLMGIPCRDF